MPYIKGPVEKMNKRARNRHRSHYFPGIHDAAMRAKGVDIDLTLNQNELHVTVENKMGHPLIIQPARMKYLKLSLIRNGETVWRNFEHDPLEDKKAAFLIDFEDEKGKPVAIPFYAKKRGFVNNLGPKEKKELVYKLPSVQKDDKIVAEMYVVLAKPSCARAAKVESDALVSPILMKRVVMKVK